MWKSQVVDSRWVEFMVETANLLTSDRFFSAMVKARVLTAQSLRTMLEYGELGAAARLLRSVTPRR